MSKIESPSERLNNLSTEKRALLAMRALQLKKKSGRSESQSIPRRKENGTAPPLSFAQQRIWFLDQLEPGSPAYNIPTSVRLKGELNIAALEQTFNEIVRRHEALRTTFSMVDDKLAQIISQPDRLELKVLDIGAMGEAERESEANRLATLEAKSPFDLARGPLLRISLIKLADLDHVLLVSMHHIISDGWSVGVLIKEVATLYEAYCAGAPSPLVELPIQYADYAVWQREYLQAEVLDEQIQYWKKQLAGAPPVLELPTDRARPALQSYRGGRRRLSIPKRVTERLEEIGQEQEATIYMVLMAGFQVLMMRYSGQKDIVIGTPIAGRTRGELEGLIGFFVNTLVMRGDMRGNPRFTEMVRRVRGVALGAYGHQEVPFERLVEELGVEREMSHAPVFQVMMGLQNAPRGESQQVRGLKLSRIGGERGTSKFDMTMGLIETGEGIAGTVEYNTDLYDEATIERMIRHYERMMERIGVDEEQRVMEIEMLGEDERRQILEEWNETRRDYPTNYCIHELFQQQVERTPNAVAVKYEEEEVTYEELNRRANQLAHYLQGLGIGPEVLVGICVERSIEMIVGLLGVLKAGGAYVPLDPQYPINRLSMMIEDAAIVVLLTQEQLIDSLPAQHLQLVCLDEWEEIAAYSDANPESGAEPNNLAYVIYTSGSTGKSKGVLLEHSGLNNLAKAVIDEIGLSDRSRVLQFASFSFDASVFEVFITLIAGGRLVLSKAERLMPGPELMRLMKEEGITTVTLPPTALAVMDVEGREVETVVAAGEALPSEVARRWARAGRLINAYGPSEATVCASMGECGEESERVTIGKAISNVEMYILDEEMNPVGKGIIGDIYIGGAGVGRGYKGRAELTAESFVPHPYSREGGERLYRTGDKGRYVGEGRIEFVGRKDNQVKVRGYRIELGEIETALMKEGRVREAVVIAREEAGGEKRLVGYVVAEEGEQISTTEIREHLRESLPEYMIPGVFVMMEEMPVSPNGKIDRKALPDPDRRRPELEKQYQEPTTELERQLVGLWEQSLGVDRVGINDNFFELGGDSILAAIFINKLQEVLGEYVYVVAIFDAPTVAQLSEYLIANYPQAVNRMCGIETTQINGHGQGDESGRSEQFQPIKRVSREKGLPLSFAQQRLWFLDQLEPNSSFYNVATAVRLNGHLNTHALEQTFNEIIRRHEILRTTFEMIEGQPLQVIQPSLSVSLEPIDLGAMGEAERESEANRLATLEAKSPFDLARGPLLRVSLIKLADLDHVLLVSMHHIISDGWSVGVLIKEVATLYEAYCAGAPSPLVELPIQYADYAVWQREYLQAEVLDEQIQYWKKQLAGAPPVLELPTDRARPALQSYRGGRRRLSIPKRVTERLEEIGQEQEATIYMVLMAGFQVLMMRYSGQKDIVIGTPIAGRTRGELEGLIGFFVNTLVMRGDMRGNPRFTEMVRRVRGVALGAYGHQEMPFERLVEELGVEREMSHAPVFQVMMGLQNAPRGESQQVRGLKLSRIGGERGTSKFDMTMGLIETGEGIAGTVEYNTDLYDEATIERMIRHYERMMERIGVDEEQRVMEIEMLGEDERRQILEEWNDTGRYYPGDKSIQEIFQQQVEVTPDLIAVKYGEEEISYEELNRRANQLAHYLRKRGVGPEVLVGVCLERSIEMIVVMLGVVKAGGGYVPLNGDDPIERLSYMLEETMTPVVVTEEGLVEKLPVYWGQVIVMEEQSEEIAGEEERNPEAIAGPENVVYVMYTSGSTGKPKGVSVVNKGVVRLVKGSEYVELGKGEVILQYAPATFDASTFEIWGALLNGGRLVVMPPGVTSLEDLGRVIASEKITTLWLTAGLFQQMVQVNASSLAGVRQLLAGGDVLPVGEVKQVIGALTEGQSLTNGYGPTENTTFTCSYRMEKSECLEESVPIGGPITNTQVYVLDEEMGVVPVGVIGELYIGGEGLARGYVNQPGQSAEKFLPDPHTQQAGGRLYRTGDLVRYMPDGNIAFVGRKDNQVKVRGYRIELGEIETALMKEGRVREAVVIAREEAGGEKRLVGYVVAEEGEQISTTEIREHLRESLPEYMIPGVFVMMEEMPVSPNGKIDRKALPEPEQKRPDLEQKYAAPRTTAEEMLAGIWADVLRLEKVGIHDDFFEIGGHSLLATQVISHVRESFSVDIPLVRLFEAPTVKGLAEIIEEALMTGAGLQAPPITLAPRDQNLPLSFSQQREWVLDQLNPGTASYNIPVALRLQGELNVSALEMTISEIIRRHESLRTTFSAVDGSPVQIINPAEPLSLSVVDLSNLPEQERQQQAALLAAEEANRPFDLATGPLLRAGLIRLADHDHVLLFTLHHIVSDGWSMGVLMKEVAALYEAFSAGKPSPLDELHLQYADFAYWQRQWLQGEVLEAQLAYWRRQLESVPVLEIPTDRPRPPVQTFNGANEPVIISKEVSEQIKRLSQREGSTLFMTLLTAMKVLLMRYSGQDDLSVGTFIAGRNRREVEGLVGFFINNLALRTDLSGAPSFTEALRRVREVTIAAYAHQDIPFEKVLEDLKPQREPEPNAAIPGDAGVAERD